MNGSSSSLWNLTAQRLENCCIWRCASPCLFALSSLSVAAGGEMNRMLLILILNGVLYLKGIQADKIKSDTQWGNFPLSRNLKQRNVLTCWKKMVKLSRSVDQRWDFAATSHRRISCAIACTLGSDTCLLYPWKWPCNPFLGDSHINWLLKTFWWESRLNFFSAYSLIWREKKYHISDLYLKTLVKSENYRPLWMEERTLSTR